MYTCRECRDVDFESHLGQLTFSLKENCLRWWCCVALKYVIMHLKEVYSKRVSINEVFKQKC